MPIDSRKYYRRGVLFPAVLIVVVHFISYLLHENSTTPEPQGEYVVENTLTGIGFVFVLLNTIFVLALCLPIFLLDMFNKGKISRFLWWFLLPGSWLIYLSWSGIQSWSSYPDHNGDAVYMLSNSLPYIVGLIWSYMKYIGELSTIRNGMPDLEVITKDDRKIEQSHTPPPQSPMG